MPVFQPLLANVWCLIIAVMLVLMLGTMTVISARARREWRQVQGYPAGRFPKEQLAASAPLESLAALHTRLVELQQYLPPGSSDARWLGAFAGRLRLVMDAAYARLETTPPPARARLLERLDREVAALAGVVNLQLGASLSDGTDRQALEAQLGALRDMLKVRAA